MTYAIIRVLLLHILTSSLTASSLRKCTEDDICQSITFNQLALAELQSDMRNFMTSFNSPMGISNTNSSVESELTACRLLNSDLKIQVTSLQEEVTSLQEEVTSLQKEVTSLQEEVTSLQEEVTSLEEKNEQQMSCDQAIGVKEESLQRDIKKLHENLAIMNKTIKSQAQEIRDLKNSLHSPVDCADIQIQGQTESGIYSIFPTRTESESIDVLCDLESNDGGWTVFLHRQPQDEPLDFNESWEEFRDGFGNVNTEYWLGNDFLHILTSLSPSTLRVDAENFQGEKKWAEWNIFAVADEENKYQLTLTEYNENSILGDGFSANNGSFFTTYDADHDSLEDLNCAVGSTYSSWGKGGWWYGGCGSIRPTAPLINTDYWDSACWLKWNRQGTRLTSIKTLSMKFRRQNYKELVANSI